jgi:hypothetical protein
MISIETLRTTTDKEIFTKKLTGEWRISNYKPNNRPCEGLNRKKRIEKQRCCFGENAHISATQRPTTKRETEMKRTIKFGVMGMLLAVGVAQSNAQPSNWVQSATASFKAYIAGAISAQTANNKIFLAEFLSGATSTNAVGGGTTTFTTNSVVTPTSGVAEFDVTNDVTFALSTNSFVLTNIFTTNGALVFSNFPASLTATNITFQTLGGTNVATNQTITLTKNTNAATPTYTFNNLSSSNGYAYTNVFAVTNSTGTNLPAAYISAVLQTNSTTNQLIFSLEYSTLVTTITTNTSGGGTNITLPAFDKTAKLVFVSPIGSTSISNGIFEVQEGTGKNLTFTDVSDFITLEFDPNIPPVTLGTATYSVAGFSLAATGSAAGNTTILHGSVFFKSGTKSTNIKNVGKETVLGTIAGTILGYGTFNGAALTFSGTLNISGGTAE